MDKTEQIGKTTVCYIEHNEEFLMLYRNKKQNDINEGKWIGVGGKIEPSENPNECNMREVREETGLILNSAQFLGIVKFRSDMYGNEDMYLYYSDDFEPEDEKDKEIFIREDKFLPPDCDEGVLKWIKRSDLMALPMWEGDKSFLEPILKGAKEISMTIKYQGDNCTVINE